MLGRLHLTTRGGRPRTFLQLLRKLALKLNADEQYLATGVEQIQQPLPELIEAPRSSAGSRAGDRSEHGRRETSERARGSGVTRPRALGALALARRPGRAQRAAAYARDALAPLDYADDLSASA